MLLASDTLYKCVDSGIERPRAGEAGGEASGAPHHLHHHDQNNHLPPGHQAYLRFHKGEFLDEKNNNKLPRDDNGVKYSH